MHIRCNMTPRLVLDWEQLTQKEQAEFDYFDPKDGPGNFVRYRGWVYDLNDFTAVPRDLEAYAPNSIFYGMRGWDGYVSDSYFSGVVMKYTPDLDHVVMGTYTC